MRQFFIGLATFLLCSVLIWQPLVYSQISQLPPPALPDPILLEDIFKNVRALQEQFRQIEFKERVSFRLAGVVNEDRRNQNIDFRQTAEYLITIRPKQPIERKFLQDIRGPRFGQGVVQKNFDLDALQETLPEIAGLYNALLQFVSKEFINGYKELGKEKIDKRPALKLELRFRPGRMVFERCILWIDAETHQPLKSELKVGNLDRYRDVVLHTDYKNFYGQVIPESIHQEMSCSGYERGMPIRLEQTRVYSEWRRADN
jgi:hypothetical protein